MTGHPTVQRFLPLVVTAAVFVVLFGVGASLYPRFATPLVVANLFRDNAYLGVVAVGMTFVILSGGIDLSVGTVLGFSTIFVAKLVALGMHPAAAMVAAVAVGAGFGGLQGTLIQVYSLPPFLVTLAGLFFAKGMAFVVHLQSLTIDHPWFSAVAAFRFRFIGGAPVTLATMIFVAVFVLALVLAHATRFGRNVYAVGGSEPSAALLGLPVARTRIAVYALSGFCAALGGVVYALVTKSGNPAIGLGLELDAIACTVIGGTLLTGGVGFLAGTLFGVLIFGTIKTGLLFHGGLDSSWLRISMGALLLAFITLQRALTGRAPGGR